MAGSLTLRLVRDFGISNKNVEKAQAALPTEKTVAIYCRSGRRSSNAAGKLADVGYKCVNLKGAKRLAVILVAQ